jgi:hypothetical protein
MGRVAAFGLPTVPTIRVYLLGFHCSSLRSREKRANDHERREGEPALSS